MYFQPIDSPGLLIPVFSSLNFREQNLQVKQNAFDLRSFRKVLHSPCQFCSCTLTNHATAFRSRCCPLISHYPPCFKSIVNYLPKNSLFWSSQRSGQYRAGRDVSGRGVRRYSGWKILLPPLPFIGPSVSLSVAGIPFCTVQALHFSPPHNFHFSG